MYSTLFSIRDKLQQSGLKLVLAESCTAGLVAAELGKVPGISEFFCGSMVVYQSRTKTAWLNIAPDGLEDPQRGPVSQWASCSLAENLLECTPHASVAFALTGHLGPGAPQELDGVVFGSFRARNKDRDNKDRDEVRIELRAPAPSHSQDYEGREARQLEATMRFLEWIAWKLSSDTMAH
ncbi:MAG: CinA family protein [Planctomycetes bacterium]|nr:CinA family protein [Planctomycetota bacterium]